ncbi:hypothetical protein B0T10DRAFT_456864 [Thelonectria olida]|uniref:Uncharacterized protein n=1 Tax=Thelonectria olida TaxID=1576542 RepID=A0A9P8WAF3_9HYPO|nr:hypothetical protein B0T10DRAFT_456864 [Thelonectria olida]
MELSDVFGRSCLTTWIYKNSSKALNSPSSSAQASSTTIRYIVRPSTNEKRFFYTLSPKTKEWEKRDAPSQSNPESNRQSWDGQLIYPGSKYALFKYVFNLDVRGGGDGCQVWLSSMPISYIEDWARGDPILWRTVKLQFPASISIKIKRPKTQAVVTFSKFTKTYLLYVFLLDPDEPEGIISFAVRLRTDGSLDTLEEEIKIDYFETIAVNPGRHSDLRAESTDKRVFCFWTHDGKVTGKSAPLSGDGASSNMMNGWISVMKANDQYWGRSQRALGAL